LDYAKPPPTVRDTDPPDVSRELAQKATYPALVVGQFDSLKRPSLQRKESQPLLAFVDLGLAQISN